ncbi:carboxylesterase/lipase family protein [Nocardia sp. BMG111209]|uniref:carboxylesterase/lipase family protein n=1 Tax=Nocardia sp. BMG111209 TaxID=1160137 RepID=UPI000363F5CB|nr:carboxylesterase/lipase family protein [Nocardia sp. BMG111209]
MVATEVRTVDGVVRGVAGRRVLRWRSIPYAAAPIGELRLRAPQPVQPWSGVRDAAEFGSVAPQHWVGARIGARQVLPIGEDCLTLNISAPPNPSSTPRPVMVFIHGGGYTFGTGSLRLYSGARLALRRDVVVVSINYRLGAFGYLDFSEFSTPARPFDSNLGLRDQVAALEWVQRNIAGFGGDPDNVTVFGESAGAHAVVTLLTTPSAAGLFHRAIAQSAPADWVLNPVESRTFARRVLDKLGVAPEDAAAALESVGTDQLRHAMERALGGVLRRQPGSFPIAPVVDGEFLPRPPLVAIDEGDAHAVPLIIGTNRDEATLFKRFDPSLPTTPEQLRQALARCGEDEENRIVAAYPGYPKSKVAVRMGGDFTFWRPSVAVAQGHSRYAPTYMYRMDYAPPAARLAGLNATHALELIPVFGAVDSAVGRSFCATGGYRRWLSVQREFQENWLSFARTGTPLPSWPQYTEQRRATRIIDAPARVEVDPETAKRLAWEGIRVPAMS